MTLMLLACWVGSPVTGYKSVRAVRRRGPAVSAVLSFNSLPDLWHSLCLQTCAQATSQTPPTASLLPTLLIQKSGYTRLPYFINRWGCPEKLLKQFYLNTGSKLTEYGRFWRTSTTGSNSSEWNLSVLLCGRGNSAFPCSSGPVAAVTGTVNISFGPAGLKCKIKFYFPDTLVKFWEKYQCMFLDVWVLKVLG